MQIPEGSYEKIATAIIIVAFGALIFGVAYIGRESWKRRHNMPVNAPHVLAYAAPEREEPYRFV